MKLKKHLLKSVVFNSPPSCLHSNFSLPLKLYMFEKYKEKSIYMLLWCGVLPHFSLTWVIEEERFLDHHLDSTNTFLNIDKQVGDSHGIADFVLNVVSGILKVKLEAFGKSFDLPPH